MSADSFDLDRNTDAATSPTIKVEIYDQAYTVRSDGDPEYLKELAEYVDQRMREISGERSWPNPVPSCSLPSARACFTVFFFMTWLWPQTVNSRWSGQSNWIFS